MRLQLFVICFILHSIHGLNDSEVTTVAPLTSIIMGGYTILISQAPYQCSLQTYGQHFCGCSVINSNYILTASHCISETSPKDVKILVGTNDLSTGGTYYDAEQLIPHEHYNTPKSAYDIGLVKVNRSIEFNGNVQPIELDDKDVPNGVDVNLTGWGSLKVGGESSDKLQCITLHILQTDECKKTSIGADIHDSHICTDGTIGKGACNKDSGGPLVYGKKIVGIVNFGYLCGIGYPDVYAKVSYFYDWIKNHTSPP